ncbi:hypothetical protein NVIE_029560 [Nitrososphaera viennensis EN76]|uniref:Uncharacterized protein n=1 Tax=Nitrososphaera viennensis EN76 TaxID=926571 RepID=A0A060HL35_9ARCH|nr:hypothetical protein NVIE_029560 [Nitrososphaera viennensis EN76]
MLFLVLTIAVMIVLVSVNLDRLSKSLINNPISS